MEESPLFQLLDLLLRHGPWGVLSIVSVSFVYLWLWREKRIVRLIELEGEKTRDLIRLYGIDARRPPEPEVSPNQRILESSDRPAPPQLSPSKFIPEGSDKPVPRLAEPEGSGVGGSTSAAVPAIPEMVTRSYP